jgi:microcystin-dependent protein
VAVTTDVDDAGGGTAHNNMQPFILGTWYIKL